MSMLEIAIRCFVKKGIQKLILNIVPYCNFFQDNKEFNKYNNMIFFARNMILVLQMVHLEGMLVALTLD